MQYSIIQKSQLEGALRIDAEYFCCQNFLQNDYFWGSQIIDYVQYGTSEDLNEEYSGFPVLRLNEINNVFINKPSKYCNKITNQTFDNLKLKKGDVLICRTNGNPKLVGKSGIIMENSNIAFASYLYRIKPNEKYINSASLVTFLNSKIGRSEIEKNMMISNQTNFSPAKFDPTKTPDSEFKYVELANINSSIGIIDGFTNVLGKDAPSRARRVLKTGDVIVSTVEGSLEKVALVDEVQDGYIASTGFSQFRSKELLPEVVLVLAKSIVLQWQFKKHCAGTILTAIPSESLQKILIPTISSITQEKIAELVRKSHEARKKSKELLEQAKRRIEEMIENEHQ